jgi:hypothetical protein
MEFRGQNLQAGARSCEDLIARCLLHLKDFKVGCGDWITPASNGIYGIVYNIGIYIYILTLYTHIIMVYTIIIYNSILYIYVNT